MKKRLLALFLAIIMIVTAFPGAAMATGDVAVSEKPETDVGSVSGSDMELVPCPVCGEEPCVCVAEEEPEGQEDSLIGAVVKFSKSFPYLWYEPGDANCRLANASLLPTLMRITEVCVVSESLTLYRLEGLNGEWYESYEDSHYANSTQVQVLLPCKICGNYDCAAEHVRCEICGEWDCVVEHVYCPVCGEWDCPLTHAYCGVCGELDCGVTHIYCEICHDFDCGMEHEKPPVEVWTPATAPIIPETPRLPDTYDVAILDASGFPVTEDSDLQLGWMEQTSISAWSALGEGVTYQWQIFISEGDGFWVDISGQTGKGLLFSRAMLMSALDDSNSTLLRCVTALDGEAMTSEAVRVTIDIPKEENGEENTGEEPVLFAMSGRHLVFAASRAVDTVTVTIHYREVGGAEISGMNPYRATIPAGEDFEQTVLLPSRPGYAPYWDANNDGKVWTEDGYYDIAIGEFVEDNTGTTPESAETVTLSLSAEETTENTDFHVYYLPIKVNVGIRYYFQNVDNDEYAEVKHFTTYLRTGTEVTEDFLKENAPNSAGFTRMVHNSEPVAADGSTVFECYYDREYIMIYFSLSGGYGVEPIYARYETPISVPEPTKPGYAFGGWDLLTVDTNGDGIFDQGDGVGDVLPATVPVEELWFGALWEVDEGGSKYTVAYWRENADPEPDGTYDYSLWGTVIVENATAGDVVHGSDNVPSDIYYATIDGKQVNEKKYFTYNDLRTDKNVVVTGDGKTVVNVYYARNTYTLRFRGFGKCAIPEHTHGTGCNSYPICGQQEHTHTAECGEAVLTCPLAEHTAHTDACLICGKTEHTEHTDGCLTCTTPEHTEHTDISCYTTQTLTAGSSAGGTNISYWVRYPTNGNVYRIRTGNNNNRTYHNFFYFNNTWYYLGTGDNYAGITLNGTLSDPNYNNSPTNVAAKMRCTIHTHGASCYKDTIHTHVETCYKDTIHTHTDACYDYPNCTKVQTHTHTDACYSDCTLLVHTHSDNCNSDHGDNIVYVLTAKYNANIAAVWPTYEVLRDSPASGHYVNNNNEVVEGTGYNADEFRGWTNITNSTLVSKRVNMTSDLCDAAEDGKIGQASYNSGTATYMFYMFESLDQSSAGYDADFVTGKYRVKHSNGKYYDSDPAYFQLLTLSGNFSAKEIVGMTPLDTGYIPNSTIQQKTCKVIYYDRNRHTLKFQSIDTLIEQFTKSDVMYGKVLAEYEPPVAEIPYHPNLEAGGYYFDGWYYDTSFVDAVKVNFAEDKMPDGDLTLHAKWSEEKHIVRFFRHYEYLEEWENTPEGPERDALTAELIASGGMLVDEEVLHGHLVSGEVEEVVLKWTYNLDGKEDDTAELFGFFYMDDGQKKAFSPQDIPVRGDMNVYVEWRGQEDRPYRIEYVLAGSSPVEYVAEPTKGYARVGVLRTFFAKAGEPYNQLYDLSAEGGKNYNIGYFPLTPSHSMVMRMEDGDDEAVNNVYQFQYAAATNVSYRVHYLEEGTNKVLAPEKVVNNVTDAVVTESYVVINDGDKIYVPDASHKRLTISVVEDPANPGSYIGDDDANVITFYYTETETDAIYIVHHMLEKLGGDRDNYAIDGSGGYLEDKDRLEDGIAHYDTNVTVSAKVITGFEAVRAMYYSKAGATNPQQYANGGPYSIKVTKDGAHLYIFYQRESYNYTVHFYEEATTKPVKDSVTGTALFGDMVSYTAPAYADNNKYKLISENPKSHVMGSVSNEIIFYYQPIEYEAKYIAVPTEGGGFDRSAEISRGDIPFYGAKPTENKNYKFEGWYLDEECTEPVTDGVHAEIDEENRLIPILRMDGDDPITEYTFYAKFKLLAADFIIEKINAEPGQVFVYRVVGDNGISIDVTVQADANGEGSTTIGKLPFGNYFVTPQTSWSWRYIRGTEQLTSHDGTEENSTVTFGDGAGVTKWLSGISNLVKRIFSGG